MSMPARLRGLAVTARLDVSAVVLSVGSARECNLCGWTGVRFLRAGAASHRRPDLRCPSCRSLPRHRFAYAVLSGRIAGGQRTLHVAPEPEVMAWLDSVSAEYLSIDIEPGRAMRQMSLTHLDLEDESFTLIFCSHVLEHVPDDAAAMAELHRVLAPGGVAVVMVPTRSGPTDEDDSITTDAGRLARFGQADHVRMYGSDLPGRLEAAGFVVETLTEADLPASVVGRGALGDIAAGKVFLCR
jgi:SAM-dependent methyltransferase